MLHPLDILSHPVASFWSLFPEGKREERAVEYARRVRANGIEAHYQASRSDQKGARRSNRRSDRYLEAIRIVRRTPRSQRRIFNSRPTDK